MDAKNRIGNFFNLYPEVKYPKGTVIINGGDLNGEVYFLESGIVREYCISQTGNLFIVHMYGPGSFFPHHLFKDPDQDTNYFDTITPSLVRIAPANIFSDFVFSDRELLKEFTMRLLKNLSNMNRRMGVIASGNAYQRTASTLAYLGKTLGKPIGGNGGGIY